MKPESRRPRLWLRAILFWCLLGFFSGCSQEHPGQAVYQKKCSQCHGMSGQGLRNLYPPLDKSPYLSNRVPELPCLIIEGSRGAINAGGTARSRFMPPIKSISTPDLLTLLDFLQGRWSTDAIEITQSKLEAWLLSCKT